MPLQPLDLHCLLAGSPIAIGRVLLIYWLEDHIRWREACAALFQARYGLGLPDALQVSTSVQSGAVALVTHDRDFAGCAVLPILSAQP